MENIPTKYPFLTEHDYQKVRFHRGLLTHPKEIKDFGLRRTGEEGELKQVDLLKKFLPNNWLVLRNVWLDASNGKTEVDILVISPKFLWIHEVKNYTGNFEYRQDECYVNQKLIQNQVAACRNRVRIVKDIAQRVQGYTPDVYATMVFINEQCVVKAEPLQDIAILMNYQVPWHIDEMIKLNEKLPHYIQTDNFISLLEKYEIANPYLPKEIDRAVLNDAIKGIRCYKCNNYEVRCRHRYIMCQTCNHTFSKTQAVLQAACELSVLLHTDPKILTVRNLYNFTAGHISKKGIRSILKQYIPQYGLRKATYYANYGLPYDIMKERFMK